MTQLTTSLRFADLPDVVALLASVGCTGRLQLTQDQWTGNLVFRGGQIVAASLGTGNLVFRGGLVVATSPGTETGQAALEGIAIGILEGDLTYVDAHVSDDIEPLLSQDQSSQRLDELHAEGRRLLKLVPSLRLVPRLVDVTDLRVTVSAAELQLIPVLVAGGSLDQIAQQQGLVRTVRGVARLVEAGLVRLDNPPTPAVAAPARPASWPARAHVPAAQAVRTPEAPPVSTPTPVQRHGPTEHLARLWQRGRLESASPPRARVAPPQPPVAVRRAPSPAAPLPEAAPTERPRPAVQLTAASPLAAATAAAPEAPEPATPETAGLRGAILRFFGFDETPNSPPERLDGVA